MAAIKAISAIVMDYAKETSFFVTPHSPRDPLNPTPLNMTKEDFDRFYFDLLEKLAENQISARLPIEGLRACRIWRDVCMLILHYQH